MEFIDNFSFKQKIEIPISILYLSHLQQQKHNNMAYPSYNLLYPIFVGELGGPEHDVSKLKYSDLVEIKYLIERELNDKKRKNEEKFHCNFCDKDIKKSNAESHVKGKKHIANINVNIYDEVIYNDGYLRHVDYHYLIEIKVEINKEYKKRKNQKGKKYCCEVCDKIVNKSDSKKHVLSQKHRKHSEETQEKMYGYSNDESDSD